MEDGGGGMDTTDHHLSSRIVEEELRTASCCNGHQPGVPEGHVCAVDAVHAKKLHPRRDENSVLSCADHEAVEQQCSGRHDFTWSRKRTPEKKPGRARTCGTTTSRSTVSGELKSHATVMRAIAGPEKKAPNSTLALTGSERPPLARLKRGGKKS